MMSLESFVFGVSVSQYHWRQARMAHAGVLREFYTTPERHTP